MQASHGKRKQRPQEAGEEQGVEGQPRKAAKRGAGQAPSQVQKRAKYTSPGKALRGPSRQVSALPLQMFSNCFDRGGGLCT